MILENWDTFATIAGGAAAALTGLLFVAISINLDKIVKDEKTLSTRAAEALATLLPSFNFPRQSNSGGSDHVRAAQLRGMSPDQVLVLVNGKRFHTSALVNTDTKIGRGTTPEDGVAVGFAALEHLARANRCRVRRR